MGIIFIDDENQYIESVDSEKVEEFVNSHLSQNEREFIDKTFIEIQS